MNRPIRIAAVGLGWVAEHRHLPAMDRNTRFNVVGVIDRTKGRAARVASARRYLRHAEASRLTDVPWLAEVDAVTIAVAPSGHYALAKEALALGKHVLTEKPFTMSVLEGEDLVQTAIAAGRHLGIVHNFQFARSMKRLKHDLGCGAFGQITGLDAAQLGNPARRLPAWYEDLPLGLFYDESPHLLYLIQAIAGPVRVARVLTVPSTTGAATPARIEAWLKADERTFPIRMSCNFEAPISEWYVIVSGEKRLGIVDVFRDIYITLPNDGTHDARRVLRTSWTATLQHWRQHFTSGIPYLTGALLYGNDEVFDRFAQAIGGDAAALEPIGASSALSVLRLQHAIIAGQEFVYRE